MSLPPSYFEGLYAASDDPWGFSTRAYEARKYALTLAALPQRNYRRAFEPGCSIGTFSRLLASRVDQLVASDVSELALERARAQGQPANVTFGRRVLPEEWPEGRFDLIVFSELGYYFDVSDLDRFLARVGESLDADGHLIAVHWRTRVKDYPQSGEAVHARLSEAPLLRLAHYEDEFVLLDVFGTTPSAGLVGPEA